MNIDKNQHQDRILHDLSNLFSKVFPSPIERFIIPLQLIEVGRWLNLSRTSALTLLFTLMDFLSEYQDFLINLNYDSNFFNERVNVTYAFTTSRIHAAWQRNGNTTANRTIDLIH